MDNDAIAKRVLRELSEEYDGNETVSERELCKQAALRAAKLAREEERARCRKAALDTLEKERDEHDPGDEEEAVAWEALNSAMFEVRAAIRAGEGGRATATQSTERSADGFRRAEG